ncbi:hypothetical protein IH992_07525 [Candidatus Poribacteria bacterium]|nr:hypothetical protein [Candidatus Poribacteria bacterium]
MKGHKESIFYVPRFIFPLIFSIAAICPFILLRVSDRFYHLIGNQHPSHFLGLILFSILASACTLIMSAPEEHRRKRTFQICSIVLWGIFLLSVVDFILNQMVQPYTTPQGWRTSDATLRFRYKPYVQWEGWFLGDQTHWDTREKRFVQYRMDHNGFRNKTDLQTADIVCVGDSFTVAGSRGERTYPATLSQLTEYDVANLGRGSYSAQQELEVLRRYALPLKPKVLIWQVFEGNDLEEAASYQDWRDGQQHSAVRKAHRKYKIAFKQLLNRSIILRTLRRIFMPSKMQFGYTPAGSVDQVSQNRGWPPLKASLTEGIQLAKASQIRTILIFFPCKASLYQRDVKRPGMATLVEELAQNLDIDFIDFWEIYRTRYLQSRQIYYWFNDSHISDAGGRLVAQVLAETIRQE